MIPETPAEHYGAIVVIVLGAIVVIGTCIACFRQFVWKWFTPDQARLLYFLLFILAGIYLDAAIRQRTAAQPERASPADQALQELAGEQLTPLN